MMPGRYSTQYTYSHLHGAIFTVAVLHGTRSQHHDPFPLCGPALGNKWCPKSMPVLFRYFQMM
jgi:hypothetical protein